MGCILVFLRGFVISINLSQDKSVWIIDLLDNIKPDHTIFQQTIPGIFQTGVLERLNRIFFHNDMNLDDEHDFLLAFIHL
jgi:hypothetical protein